MEVTYKFFGSIEDKANYKELTKKYFLQKWNDGGGFFKLLCDTITASDYENMDKLYESYPELVDGYCMYHLGVLYETATIGKAKKDARLNEYTNVGLKKVAREVSIAVGFEIEIANVGEGLITAYWTPGEIAILMEVNTLTKIDLVDLLQKMISRWEDAHREESLDETIDGLVELYNRYDKDMCNRYHCFNCRMLMFSVGWETGM
jgi:hypothetical protein